MVGNYISYRSSNTELTVADILREHWAEYREQYPVTAQQAKVVGSLLACRTPALGGRLAVCAECGVWVFSFNSCRDRHCNQCQKYERAQWVEKQQEKLLPIPYFHIVFTTDHALNPLIRANQRLCYNLLFETVRRVLQARAGVELGCELGITAVLHTWGQQVQEHYHIHCIVTGGGLALDGSRWVRSKSQGYLVNVVKLSAVYREALCDGLRQVFRRGQLSLTGVDLPLEGLLDELKHKLWEVFAKPFTDPELVLEYLSRYVHQVAISNYRLLKLAGGQVTFEYYDHKERAEVGQKGKQKQLTLPAVEFIRRFLSHILPPGFRRIRYFGLHASAARTEKLPRCRALWGLPRALPVVKALTLLEWLKQILGADLNRCPHCGAPDSLVHRAEFETLPWLVALLLAVLGQPTRQGVSR